MIRWGVMLACLGCYHPSYSNCEISCTPDIGCPSGYTCDEQLHLCRSGPSCNGTDAGSNAIDATGGADANLCGWTYATNFDPCAVSPAPPSWNVSTATTFDTVTGTGTGIAPPNSKLTTTPDGVTVRIIDVGMMTTTADLRITGAYPLIIVARSVSLEAPVNASSAHSSTSGCTGGVGAESLYGGGGGAGGGLAGSGGKGGEGGNGTAGTVTGNATAGAAIAGTGIMPLRAGCPGFRGGAPGGGTPGAGGQAGGAIEISARDTMSILSTINVNGGPGAGGGTPATPSTCSGNTTCGAGGGGGGSGGLVFLESPAVQIGAKTFLCANGGGGGGGIGGSGTSIFANGGAAVPCTAVQASGGAGVSGGADGAPGGGSPSINGTAGGNNTSGSANSGGGGGGGGAGHVVIRTGSAGITVPSSPALQTL